MIVASIHHNFRLAGQWWNSDKLSSFSDLRMNTDSHESKWGSHAHGLNNMPVCVLDLILFDMKFILVCRHTSSQWRLFFKDTHHESGSSRKQNCVQFNICIVYIHDSVLNSSKGTPADMYLTAKVL